MLNWKERGTTESENSSGYERVKSRWETTQKSLPVEVYLQWLEQRKAVHSYNTITSTYVQVSSLSPTANLTHFEVSMKNKWGWECDGACTLSPRLHGGVCVCEGSLKQYYTRRLILFERRRPVQILECVDGTHSKSADLLIAPFTSFRGWTTLTGGTKAQSTDSHFAPSPCVIKSLYALPSIGVSVSCRHAVSHFKPVMTILGAGLTPVVIRLPAVYPLTPLRSKISLCSVSVWEEKTLFYRALVVEVGLYSS